MGNLICCPIPGCSKEFRTSLPLRHMDGSTVVCQCTAHLAIFSESGKPIKILAECDECSRLIETGEPLRCEGTCKRVLCSKCATDYNGKQYCAGCFETALAADGIGVLKVPVEMVAA